jgi:hypothetical protein
MDNLHGRLISHFLLCQKERRNESNRIRFAPVPFVQCHGEESLCTNQYPFVWSNCPPFIKPKLPYPVHKSRPRAPHNPDKSCVESCILMAHLEVCGLPVGVCGSVCTGNCFLLMCTCLCLFRMILVGVGLI